MTRRIPRFALRALTPSETDQHIAILGMLRIALPQRAVIFHVPNGIEASPAAWNRVLQLGALAGFPDIAILLDGRIYTQEVKIGDAVQSADQRDCAALLQQAGVPVAVVRTPADALAACETWGLPTRRMRWHGASPVLPPPRPDSHAGILLADWTVAAAEAVRAWRELLIAAPPQMIFAELAGLENRLRQLALTTLPPPAAREHVNAPKRAPTR